MSFLSTLLDIDGFGALDAGIGTYDAIPTVVDPIYYENSGIGTTAGGGFYNPNVGNIYYENDGTVSIDTGAGGVGAGNISASDATKLINADKSGILKSLFVDKDGNLNLKTLAGIGGGLLGALGANTPNRQKSGYQGSIPKYDAVRSMVTAPPTRAQGYRPGQGGINYGGDVSFVPKGSAPAPVVPVAPVTTPEVKAAHGGLMELAKGRYLQGETDGMADKIPAQIGQDQPAALSHGEFVVPADVVSHLGNGNSDAGAKKLYQMMDKIRTARTGTKKQGKEINPDKFMPGGLATAYAAGGEVKKFAGTTGSAVSGLGTAANAGVTGSETVPNTFAGEYIADMLGKTQALANAPYQQYMGPLTAGESGLQSKVFGGLQSMNFPSNLGASFSSAGAYAPPQMNMGAYQQRPIGTGQGAAISQDATGMPQYGEFPTPDATMDSGQQPDYQPQILFGSMGQPGQMPQGGLAGLAGRMPQQQPQQPQGIASQYMNPYLQNVLTPQMEEMRRQAQINNLSGLGALTKSGAFGGGRQAIMESEAARNLLQEQNKTIGAGYSNAFDKAMSQFNTEQARDLGLAKFMSDQGTTQRGIEAEGIAADKAAFEAARENPYKMLQFQQSMLQGMPISATNIDMATPSTLQEILSGIGGGIKMVGNNPSNIALKDVTDLLGNLGLGK